MPVWWPHSWYNLRYGMELLPAFALCLGFAAHFMFDLFGPRAYKLPNVLHRRRRPLRPPLLSMRTACSASVPSRLR